MAYSATLIPGDGVGPELTGAAQRVLAATGVEIEWDLRLMGAVAMERAGTPLPEDTLQSIRERGVALKGPVSTPSGRGFRSVNTALRRELDLYLNIRPCHSFPGLPAAREDIDVVVVRMTGEDLYAGLEYQAESPEAFRLLEFFHETAGVRLAHDSGISIKPISRSAVRRATRGACAWACSQGRGKLTIVHKATVMRCTDGVFLQAARELAQAEFPELHVEDRLVDAMCHDLVARPPSANVLFAPMLYGDILADLCAGLVGGLGLAPGVNLGTGCAVFEAVHGTAPRLVGKGRANPMALILCGAMLLRHLGEQAAARAVERAVGAVIRQGVTTYDLRPGGDPAGGSSTSEVIEAVVAALQAG